MKRLISALLIGLFATFAVVAQTYSIPKKLPLEPAVRREFRGWVNPAARYPGLIPETFFPIGWSRDGKFAYYIEPVDEECGCYFAHFVIQDMRTDKIVWEFKYNQDDTFNDKGEMTGPGTLRALWKKNAKLFSDKLSEHAILPRPSILLGKTFTSGSAFTTKALVTMGKDQYDDDRVTRLSITLSSKKLGIKSVYFVNHTKDEYNGTLDAAVLGAIKSPFEDRVAIVGMEVSRGWEGPPHTGDIFIVGADLTSGFGERFVEPPIDRAGYPDVWFAPINDPNKPAWEILPQEAKEGEVILSKRNELGILSNFAATPFELYGKRYASVEGFWQMMLYPESETDERAKDKRVIWKYTREQVAQMTAFEAKAAGTLAEENMKKLGIDWVTFEGKRFPYRSQTIDEHYRLIHDAMRAKLDQNPEVKRILLATGNLILRPDHHGEKDPPPEWRYYDLWMDLRNEIPR